MELMEIILLIAGSVIFILSFFIPDRKGASEGLGSAAENEVRELVGHELESLRQHVDEVVEEAVSYAVERTERSLERLSNEKIMAVNEYSDTVLSEIHKNHEEAVFLYDMLNNKHTSLKNTLAEINTATKGAEENVRLLQQLTIADTAPDRKAGEEAMPGGRMEENPAETVGTPEKWLQTFTEPAEEETGEGAGQELSNNEKIRKLYRQGKPAVAIAKELGLGIGEVRLVIDLFRNQK